MPESSDSYIYRTHAATASDRRQKKKEEEGGRRVMQAWWNPREPLSRASSAPVRACGGGVLFVFVGIRADKGVRRASSFVRDSRACARLYDSREPPGRCCRRCPLFSVLFYGVRYFFLFRLIYLMSKISRLIFNWMYLRYVMISNHVCFPLYRHTSLFQSKRVTSV